MTEEKLNLYNGNNQEYTINLPKIMILTDYINKTALQHIEKNTGLNFVKDGLNSYISQPTKSNQIVKLFLTYNFKTKYYNNWDIKNTILLKFDHHIGFDVDSICPECIKYNHIPVNDIEKITRLAC